MTRFPPPGGSAPSALAPNDRAALERVAIPRSCAAGEPIASFLVPVSHAALLERGLATLQGIDGSDEEWILAFLRPGDWFDGSTLTREGDHVFEIVALTAVRLWTLEWTELEALGRSRPGIPIAVARSVAELAARLAEATLETRGVDVTRRLARLLLRFASREEAVGDEPVALEHPFTQMELARAIGASRPHTSHVLGELEDQGAVIRQGQHPLLVRPARLVEILENPG